MTALASLDEEEIDIRESLLQSYLFLAQFIEDDDADTVRRGQIAIKSGDPAHPDMELGNAAVGIINQIKADMEELHIEITQYLQRKAEEKQQENT